MFCTLPAPADALTECADAPTARVFCSGFEEGNFQLWDDWDGNPSPASVLFDEVVISTLPIGPRGAGIPVQSLGWGTFKALFR